MATALVSATVLVLEVTLTRMLSLFLHHHAVFLVLSVALLGLGMGATLYAVLRRSWWYLVLQPPVRTLWQVCLACGVALGIVTVLLTQTALASVPWATVALVLLPFLGSGLFLALMFTVEADQCRLLYAADLLGASLGCLGSLLALHWLGAENTLALAALSFLAPAALLALTADRQRWPIPILVCLLCGSLLGLNIASGSLALKPAALRQSPKHLGAILRTDAGARLVDSRWSALARTDVVTLAGPQQPRFAVFTDGGAATSLAPVPATPAEWAQLDRFVGLFPYLTPPRQRVLIIGSGGGFDVLLALRGGAQTVTAVEVNPDVLRAVERFLPPDRNVYRLPAVTVVRGDGRQVVRQSTQTYDLIVLPQVYTGAAQWQGGALAENYVLTVEAFQDYLAHLAPQGRLVVQVHTTAEAFKAVSMGLEALARRGIASAAGLEHILVLHEGLEGPQAPLVILKKTPYTPAEGRQQTAMLRARHLTPLFVPHGVPTGHFAGLLRSVVALAVRPEAVVSSAWPATDNRPFFYGGGPGPTSLSRVVFIACLILLGLHLGYYIGHRRTEDTASLATAWLQFFAATGCAALLVQGALLQRSMLVLGSPALTLAVLLFPLLFWGAMGSLASTMFCDHTLRRFLPWICVALGLLVGLSLVTFPVLQLLLERQGLLVRVLGIMAFLAPLGALMGLPFPVASRLLVPLSDHLVPWIWGVNTVACVLGSVAAVRFAVSWGLQEVVLGGAVLYLLAGCRAYRLLGNQPPFSRQSP